MKLVELPLKMDKIKASANSGSVVGAIAGMVREHHLRWIRFLLVAAIR
jgi:stage V sporulation protein SpoVS